MNEAVKGKFVKPETAKIVIYLGKKKIIDLRCAEMDIKRDTPTEMLYGKLHQVGLDVLTVTCRGILPKRKSRVKNEKVRCSID